MSLVPKSDLPEIKPHRPWQPSAPCQILHRRALLLRQIRDFFHARKVVEVETPILSHATVTEPHLHSMSAQRHNPTSGKTTCAYLHTSPEFAMKRLLAFGMGPIYQITKAFRQDENGRLHNPEFTILEWYRPGYDHHDLMQEIDEFLQTILQTKNAQKITYREIFFDILGIDPHQATQATLINCIEKQQIELNDSMYSRDDLLNVLLSHCIEPHLGTERPCMIYDFPASQASLARVRAGNPSLASRFEVYFEGIELANGFHELSDENEQRKRFESDLKNRKQQGLPQVPIDECLLAALAHGLPDCAGVALGIDRLILLALRKKDIREVISFDFERA